MATTTTELANERYINIESFKKDGGGVKTPVWCANLDGEIVVVTDGTSYKVKRVRRNPKVRLAACDARGNVRGPWVDGECRIIDDPAAGERARKALRDKYGWQMWMLDAGSKISGRFGRRAYLALRVTNEG